MTMTMMMMMLVQNDARCGEDCRSVERCRRRRDDGVSGQVLSAVVRRQRHSSHDHCRIHHRPRDARPQVGFLKLEFHGTDIDTDIRDAPIV